MSPISEIFTLTARVKLVALSSLLDKKERISDKWGLWKLTLKIKDINLKGMTREVQEVASPFFGK